MKMVHKNRVYLLENRILSALNDRIADIAHSVLSLRQIINGTDEIVTLNFIVLCSTFLLFFVFVIVSV